jgi:protein NrfD
MAHQFTVELNGQEEWSWLLAMDLFFGGLGGGLFILAQMFGLGPGISLLALGLVVLGAIVLLMELGHPLRAWRALLRPTSSWISRGVIFVTLFLLFGVLYTAPAFDSFSWLPWGADTLGGKTIGAIAGICALFVMLYPGFVLSASPSIPFWNNPLLPVLFVSQSLMGASSMILLISPLGAPSPALQEIGHLTAILIAANFILIGTYLLVVKGSGLAAREGVRRLSQGPLGWMFTGGVILVGTVLPLLLVLCLPSANALAGALVLTGALLFRYCVLKAGVYVPFAIA